MDYFAMRGALETGEGYAGTIEFYPEMGKYHFDGHRNCGICSSPRETLDHNGECPVCGKALTVGVLHRVEALADRDEGERRSNPEPYRNLIPLPEILAELEGVGAQAKRVANLYESLIAKLGPELPLLEQTPLDAITEGASPHLAQAIRRMRTGEVIREAGYDGKFGRIRLFGHGEVGEKGNTGNRGTRREGK